MQKGTLSRLAPEAPPVATLRLTRGSSAQAVWVAEGRPGATPIVIGSDPNCDWPIRAANVPAHALHVLADERGVYVHSGPQGQVRVDGRRLGRAWQRVKGGARFDIGLARVEVALNDHRFVPAVADQELGAPDGSTRSDPDQSGVRPSFLPRPVEVPEKQRRSLRERLSRHSLPDEPSVLGKAPRGSRRNLRYLLAAITTAGAYVTWLLLLDG